VSDRSLPSIQDLDTAEVLPVEQRCTRFETAWKAWREGPRPSLEEHLAGISEAAQDVLLCELLLLELAYRRRHGERPALADYLPRFPDRHRLLRDVFAREGLGTATASAGKGTVAVETAAFDHPADLHDAETMAAAGVPSQVEPAGSLVSDVDFEIGTGGVLRALGDPGRRVGTAIPDVQIPGYEIVKELGSGGMGVVYQARQLALKRTVALKMILGAGHAGLAQRQRFKAEAEAVARLQHPHIVQVFEVGEHQGLPFCALEFVEGGSLDKRLGSADSPTPLPPVEAARLVATLADAMHLAHSRNIVHRDLKPANILLTANTVPKVTDFGLARCLDDDSGQTQTGAVMGTPAYMAPEQASGRTHEAGPAADVYALGAILYACLTGRAPFRGATVMETLDQVRHQEPVPPDRTSGRRWNACWLKGCSRAATPSSNWTSR
jgi:hypothetical protein